VLSHYYSITATARARSRRATKKKQEERKENSYQTESTKTVELQEKIPVVPPSKDPPQLTLPYVQAEASHAGVIQ